MHPIGGGNGEGKTMTSDAALLGASKSDAGPFRELYERYARSVYGFHLRRTRDEHAALDLTAETFAQAWLSRLRFRDEAGGSAGPWLYGIARNLLAQSVRKRMIELGACDRLGVLDRLEHEPATVEPTEIWLDGLDEALDELPDGQRHAVELRVIEELDYERIAKQLGTTPGAARVRVTRGLGHLRQRLTRDEREAV
jgi:RNA polymerase sigma-70 factor (ECF subfamily)